jgi:acyl dehydratase
VSSPPTHLSFEDLTPERRFDLGSVTVERDEMLAFNRRFDPQPFHVDEEAARSSLFGGLCASGWFTASL